MLLRAFAKTPLADRGEGTPACDGCGNAEDSAVEQNLSDAKVDPVPHEKRFERPEGRHEGDDAGREQVGGLWPNVAELKTKRVNQFSFKHAYTRV